MPRDGKEVRRRLEQAALELYQEHGFDRTTTAEIAARAGVTERTFFRQFSDKREVLFSGDSGLVDVLVHGVQSAPPGLAPMTVLMHAFRLAMPMLEANRWFSEPRAAIIAKSAALQERARAKRGVLNAALTSALERRGLPSQRALLAAETGMAAFAYVTEQWIDDPSTGLDERLVDAYDDLRTLFEPDSRKTIAPTVTTPLSPPTRHRVHT